MIDSLVREALFFAFFIHNFLSLSLSRLKEQYKFLYECVADLIDATAAPTAADNVLFDLRSDEAAAAYDNSLNGSLF